MRFLGNAILKQCDSYIEIEILISHKQLANELLAESWERLLKGKIVARDGKRPDFSEKSDTGDDDDHF